MIQFKKHLHFLLLLPLFIYGFFYQITSSEFWPITITKTWLNPSQFEYSTLQKPLFSAFLAFLHILPLTDEIHIYIVKAVFAFLGILGVFYFSKFLLAATNIHTKKIDISVLTLTLVFISPLLLTNYFRMRTDQVSFLLFSAFLYYNHQKNFKKSFVSFILLPLVSIKSIIFVLPVAYLFYLNHKFSIKNLTRIHKVNLILTLLCVLVWSIGLNVHSVKYFFDTHSSMTFPNLTLKYAFKTEFILIIGSILSSIYYLFKKDHPYKSYANISIYFLFVMLCMPQAFPFFVASILSFVNLSLFLLILSLNKISFYKKIIILNTQTVFILVLALTNSIELKFASNIDQITFINNASKILKENQLTYLDGMGSMPRQNFVPCFVSPSDDEANNNCFDLIINRSSDSVLVTGRLLYLGDYTFRVLEKEYEQILPNFWIRKDKVNDSILLKQNLNSSILPITIF